MLGFVQVDFISLLELFSCFVKYTSKTKYDREYQYLSINVFKGHYIELKTI